MRILFVYNEIVVENVSGCFYHNFLGDIIDRYSKYGELTVCVAQKEVKQTTSKLVELPNNVNLKFIDKENTIKKAFFDRRNNKKTLENLIKKTDFIIIHVPCSIQGLVKKYSKKYDKPCLAIVVGCPFDSLWNHSFKGKLIAPLSYLSLRKFMAYVPYAIYVTNNFLQQRYPTTGVGIGCSDVAIPGFISKVILQNRILGIKKIDKEINLVSVGAINNKSKGHIDVIKAISKLKNSNVKYIYHLIGGGDPSYIKKVINRYKVNDQVVIHGQIPHNEIFTILCQMDVYIQPSRQEGLCRAIIEAMAVGLPIIASNVGGNPELVKKEYLYSPGDIGKLASLIKQITNKEEMINLSDEYFFKALEYRPEVLEKKRDDFIKNAIKIV